MKILRISQWIFPGLFLAVLLVGGSAWSQDSGSGQLSSWKVVKKKNFPNYKVEILERWMMGKFPRVDSMKARIVPKEGGSVTEFEATWLTPDPKEFVVGWDDSKTLDMNADGLEDLVLRNSTGGAHCCYSYDIFSLTKPFKKIGEVELQDCGEQIVLHDLNGDKKPEIISCDARFTYLGNLPYAQSPFPPAVYTLGLSGYERADKAFKQVYLEDIAKQREILKKGYKPASALQIVTDYFLMGDEKKAWEEFEALYQGEDKEKIRLQLLQKMGLTPPGAETAPQKPLGLFDQLQKAAPKEATTPPKESP